MSKSWKNTKEETELLKEITRHPVGTTPMTVFKSLRPKTWEILKNAQRIGGRTKEWSVYRHICHLMKHGYEGGNTTTFSNLPNSNPPNDVLKLEEILRKYSEEVKSAIDQITENAIQSLKQIS